MAGLEDGEDRALWRSWSTRGSAAVPAPDALDLAAYAEGRLSEAEAAPIELWLAANPARASDIFADIAAARGAMQHAILLADAAVVVKAAALVSGLDDNVVPFRRAAPAWRNALAWSSVAASLVAVSLVGFAMGSDAYRNLSPVPSGEAAATDALDPGIALDSAFSDDSGT